MRKLIPALLIAMLSPGTYASSVCGVYLVEDYTNLEVRSLTNLTSKTGRQIHYTIRNPNDDPAKTMISGVCYCVSGKVTPDPGFCGDEDFHLIEVKAVLHGCNSAL